MVGTEKNLESLRDPSGQDELRERLAGFRERRLSASLEFDKARVERQRIAAELAAAANSGWREDFDEARDNFLISKGRLQVMTERLGNISLTATY